MTCLVCEYSIAAGLQLCNHCDTRFRGIFDRVPATLKTAAATLANQGVQPRVGSAGTSAPGAPLNLDMAERLGECERRLTELAHWVDGREEPNRLRIFTKTFNAAEYLEPGAPHAQTLLRWRHLQGLHDLERRVISAVDRPIQKRPLGECGALLMDDATNVITRCEGTVEGHETATTGRCREGHREIDLTDRITERFAQAWHHIAPLAVVVRALNDAGYPINYATARQWVHRGKLHPRCDLKTRQEGHSPADVLIAFQSIPLNKRCITNQKFIYR